METEFFTYAESFYERRYRAEDICYHTWYNACSMIRSFKRFCRESLGLDALPISRLDEDILRQYKTFCLGRGNGTATINRKLVPLVTTMKNAGREGLVAPSALARLDKLYYPQHTKRYGLQAGRHRLGKGEPLHHLSDAQMKKLLSFYRDTREDRTRAALDLFFFSFHACGLRVSDILTLEWKHVDLRHGRLSKVSVKSKADITIPLPGPALEILRRWKVPGRRFVFGQLPDTFDLTDDAALARAIDNRNRSLRSLLNAVGRNLRFPFPLGMHVARHTFAVKALNSSRVSVHLISRLLGHSSVVVTEKVYARFLLPTLSRELRTKLSFIEFGMADN